MYPSAKVESIEKLETGISGFDTISHGGLPKGRVTLVAGTAGSAKTVFSAQFLVEGIRKYGQPGVFVTFEERPDDIRRNLKGFGWDVEQYEREGLWVFVDASPDYTVETLQSGPFDMSGLIARIEHAVSITRAERITLDSVSAIFSQFEDTNVVRRELFKTHDALKRMNLTSMVTAERTNDYGSVARFDVEEFVSDNVILLRNTLDEEKRRRTIEILKYRGTYHQKGEWPFTIHPEAGIMVIPLSAMELVQRSTDLRVPTGVQGLDEMCGGGYFRDSVILVSGATGTGKTMLSAMYLASAAANKERCLLFAYEESYEQLSRNARGWGVDFHALQEQGLLKIVCDYPEAHALEDHLIKIRTIIEEFQPQRVAVDSISALERVAGRKSIREFVISLTALIKQADITGLMTSTTSDLLGGASVTEAHISTITDTIILLRYVEMYGEIRRGLNVLKMRGSAHAKDIREFIIDGRGMNIGNPFTNVHGILSGHFTYVPQSEVDRLSRLFPEDIGTP